MQGDAGDADGAGARQGLSWSWELNFDALLAAITGAAPPDAATDDAASPGSPAGGTAGPAAGSPEEEAEQEAILDDLAALDAQAAAEGREGADRIPVTALAGRVAERLAPGPDLTAWLAAAPVAALDEGDLAAVAGSWRRVASWAQARELAAVAQITSRAAARDEDIGTDADGCPARVPVSAAAEVALELTMSQYGASGWAHLAVQLSWRLAATGAALAAGSIDLPRARLIAEATGMLSDETARAVQARVLPAAEGQTTGMLRAALRRAVIAADPLGTEERRKDAERRAQVVLYPDQDCTATLSGQRLPAVHAAAAMARLTAMAWALKASGAGGGIDLLRSQVFAGLLLGTLPLIPPAEGAPPDQPGDAPRDDPGDGPVDDSGEDPADDVPPPGDQDAPRDEDNYPCPDGGARTGYCDQDRDDDGWLARDWPGLPAVIPPAFTGPGSTRTRDGRPIAGLLDVSLPWQVLAGISSGPGYLGRIGPIPAIQARRLAQAAAGDPAAEWRIIVTSPDGHALAVTRIPRPPGRDRPPGDGDGDGDGQESGAGARPGARTVPGAGMGLVSRVTLTIPEDIAAHPPPWPTPSPGSLTGILSRAIQAAATAAARARAAMAADAAVGGCAHTAASPAYRPPPRLREYITARDLTCRFLRCRQPAWRGDLDHTIPFDDGGMTCRCNLGGVCRTHHLLKHHPDWNLRQVAPGVFTWTTPAGRTFTTTPDVHAA
jgi:Domain of unknown function (DUF222)